MSKAWLLNCHEIVEYFQVLRSCKNCLTSSLLHGSLYYCHWILINLGWTWWSHSRLHHFFSIHELLLGKHLFVEISFIIWDVKSMSREFQAYKCHWLWYYTTQVNCNKWGSTLCPCPFLPSSISLYLPFSPQNYH